MDYNEHREELKTRRWQDLETSAVARPNALLTAGSSRRGGGSRECSGGHRQGPSFLSAQSSVRLLQDTGLETFSHSLSPTALKSESAG